MSLNIVDSVKNSYTTVLNAIKTGVSGKFDGVFDVFQGVSLSDWYKQNIRIREDGTSPVWEKLKEINPLAQVHVPENVAKEWENLWNQGLPAYMNTKIANAKYFFDKENPDGIYSIFYRVFNSTDDDGRNLVQRGYHRLKTTIVGDKDQQGIVHKGIDKWFQFSNNHYGLSILTLLSFFTPIYIISKF
jgi:hypothetical protein